MTDSIIEKLQAALPAGIKGVSEFRGETTLNVVAEQMHEVARFLRNDPEARYDLLIDVYGTDRLKLGESPRFAVEEKNNL